MEKPFRLLIVDDQPRARQSLGALLVIDFPQINIFEASNGNEALLKIKAIYPAIIIMDVVMPECDGIEATRLIKAMLPQTKIILYSMYSEYQTVAITAGADAFITKGEPSKNLVATIVALLKPDSDSN
jgi:DNA-binding NarL/FixJ family response regulator